MYAEFCTISNFHIHLHTFKIERSLFFPFTNTTRITNFSCQIVGVQVVSSTWCGIPIAAWPVAPRGVMPSSSLTLQNSVCPGGMKSGGTGNCHGGTPRLGPRSQKLNLQFHGSSHSREGWGGYRWLVG